VAERMEAIGADPEDAQWDAKKRGDGSWLVQLTFISAGRVLTAEWVFDPRRRHVLPADDNAGRMSLPGAEPPQLTPPPGEATVTHLAPRLSTAVGHGGPGVPGRPRYERPVAAPGRPAEPAPQAPAAPVRSPAATAQPPAPAPAPRPELNGGASDAPAAQRGPLPRVAAPEPRVAAPEPRVAAPEPRVAAPEPRVAAPEPRVAAPEPRVAAPEPRVAAPEPRQPDKAPSAEPAPSQPAASQPAAAQPARQGRKAARGKRSSVPSWDEIMFGNSRQRD
jgi:hypothetical protein